MKRNQFFTTVGAAALCAMSLLSTTAQAQQAEVGSIAYLPQPAINQIEPAAGGNGVEPENNRRQWARYFEYEHREHCQNYVAPPDGWRVVNCDLQRIEQPVAMVQPLTVIEPAAGEVAPMIAHDHKIYFDFDRDNIRPTEQAEINATVSDIQSSRPSLVTVSGYADAAGTNAYNDDLSARRASNVAAALRAQGVAPDIIVTKAYGENNLAVPTADGVPLQDNRRVTVGFEVPGSTPGM